MRKNSSKKSSFSALTVLSFIVFLVFLLAYVSVKIEQVKMGYKISENQKLEQHLMKEKQSFRAELMNLKSPDHLRVSARELGFKFPTQDDVVFVEKTTVVGKRR